MDEQKKTARKAWLHANEVAATMGVIIADLLLDGLAPETEALDAYREARRKEVAAWESLRAMF